MELNVGSLPQEIKISIAGFTTVGIIYRFISKLPDSPVSMTNIMNQEVAGRVAGVIFLISFYFFLSGVYGYIIKGRRDLNISVEVPKAIQVKHQDDYFCEFTFVFNNKSNIATTLTKIEYSLPITSGYFRNPVLNILQDLPHIKAGSSEIIKDSFQYIRFTNKSHIEITFYHTYGAVQVETTINPLIHLGSSIH